MTGDFCGSVTFMGSSKLSCNATDEFSVTAVFGSKCVTASNRLRVTEVMTESSQFTQANEGTKGGLLVEHLWALIVGSILALLLICGLIMFVIFRKRRSTEPTEESPEPGGPELDGVTILDEDEFFISQYGLSTSDGQSSEEGEEDAASFLQSISNEYILEETGDNFGSEYGFSDDFQGRAVDVSDEAASGGDTDYDDSSFALGDSDDFGSTGGAESDGGLDFLYEPASGDVGYSEEPVAGGAGGYSGDDDALGSSEDGRGFE
jgi:hypothetical protein